MFRLHMVPDIGLVDVLELQTYCTEEARPASLCSAGPGLLLQVVGQHVLQQRGRVQVHQSCKSITELQS